MEDTTVIYIYLLVIVTSLLISGCASVALNIETLKLIGGIMEVAN